MPTAKTTRRALLQKISALSLAPVATPMALNLLGMANAVARTVNDYKAIVCVFLHGANDHYNTVVPYDSNSYNAYYAQRKGAAVSGTPYEGIALVRSALQATALTGTTGLPSGLQMALGPTMPRLKTLFDSGRAGILLNVGPLIVPTSRAQFQNRSVPLPPQLFSHNDQQAYWQTASEAEGGAYGWGGRTADLLVSNNSQAALTCISLGSGSLFLSGKNTRSYQLSTSGAIPLNVLRNNNLYGSSTSAAVLRSLILQSSPTGHLLETEHVNVMRRGLDLFGAVDGALGASPPSGAPFNAFSSNSLSQQLRMVARIIHQRNRLGLKRQVFMVGIGGFDNHDQLAVRHPGLLASVSDGLADFDAAMNALGMANQVTTLTASDFGRTLSSNGDGSDHGWGSHHFLVGGAVNGGRFFGKAPLIGTTHNDQVGSGRLLPSTSIEQLGVELARWFGVSDSDMSSVFPHAKNFNLHKLGIMKPVI